MAINIQKVVSTDFKVLKQQVPLSSYGNTVVIKYPGSGEIFTYDSYDEAVTQDAHFNENKYDAYIYFTLGGRKLTVLPVAEASGTENSATKIYEALLNYKKTVSNTTDDFICVSTFNLEDSVFSSLVSRIDELKAPNKLLLLRSIKEYKKEQATNGVENDLEQQATAEEDKTLIRDNNVIYKYYKCKDNSTCDAALTIAAYLSKINLTNASSLRDYCYTDEAIVVNNSEFSNTLVPVEMDNSGIDSDFDKYKNVINFIDLIGNRLVNFGGNTSAGTSIIAEYGAICVENAIIRAVLETMLQKQYLTNSGLNNVVSKIHSVMKDYITNGFLETNTTYTGSTRYYNYGNTSYTMVSTGDELVNGYIVVTIPMSKLTVEDRQARKFTPIYVYMQTLGGARTVEITGDILD